MIYIMILVGKTRKFVLRVYMLNTNTRKLRKCLFLWKIFGIFVKLMILI